jgi:hypothetical protein
MPVVLVREVCWTERTQHGIVALVTTRWMSAREGERQTNVEKDCYCFVVRRTEHDSIGWSAGHASERRVAASSRV